MSTALKVVLVIGVIVAGTIVMLGIAGVFVARSIHVHETGTGDKKVVNIDTPLGHVRVNASDELDPRQAGIPLYPGATKKGDKGGANFELDSGDLHKDFSVSGASYFTPDPPDKVREFYKRKFPEWSEKWENSAFHLETKGDGRVRTIVINAQDGGTHIGVASFGVPAEN